MAIQHCVYLKIITIIVTCLWHESKYDIGYPIVLEITLGSGKWMEKIEVLTSITGYVLTFPKIYALCTRGKEIRQLFNRLEYAHNKMSEDPDNRINLLKTENLCKKMLIYFAIFNFCSTILLFMLHTIFVLFFNFKYRQLLIQIWIPWNTDEIWANLLANIFVITMIFTGELAEVMFASVELAFTFQISACITVLQSYFEPRGPADQIIYQYHDTIIQIINDYNKIFSGAMYVETLCSSLLPCGILVTLIRNLKKKNYNQLTPDVLKVGLCMSLFTLTLSCGQEVNTQVERLHESSYMSKWYEETPKVRRDLLMLMTRTAKPTTVNYRLFITFNRECLASVLQGLYSFLTMAISLDTDS